MLKVEFGMLKKFHNSNILSIDIMIDKFIDRTAV